MPVTLAMAANVTQAQWDELLVQVQTLSAQAQQQNVALQAAQQQISTLQGAKDNLDIQVAMLESQLASRTHEKPKTLMGNKEATKPFFDGSDPKKFPYWSFKFNNFVCGTFPRAESILDWAKSQEHEITLEIANTKIAEIEGLLELNNQLYTAFGELLDSEPLSMTMNTRDRNGVEV